MAHVALLTVDLMIPFADSLKSKRRVIRSLKDRVSARFNAAVAEIACQEEWQRAVIGVAMLGNDRVHLERSLAAVERLVRDTGDLHLLDARVEWL